MAMRIAIAGVAGRMGGEVVRAAGARNMVIAGGTVRPDGVGLGEDIGLIAGAGAIGARAVASPALAGAKAEIWIDFTSPQATIAALAELVSTEVRIVIIGTTGFTPEQIGALENYGDRFVLVRSGNFSIGAAMLARLVGQLAGMLDEDWDIEIVETHHNQKLDAPSGTALMLGEAAAAGRGSGLEALRLPPYATGSGRRKPGGIGFAVRRGGSVIGEHEVMFAGAGESLCLRHSAGDRTIFAKGALWAARYAARFEPGIYSLKDLVNR